MLDYMQQKYGEHFRAMEPYAGQYGKEYSMLRVQNKKGDLYGILVRVVNEGGREIYQDNYLAHLHKKEIEQKITELAKPVFQEFKVYYKIPEMVFPEDFPADMSVEDFLRAPGAMVKMYFYVKERGENGERQCQQLIEALQKEHYIISAVISYPMGERSYKIITENTFMRDIYNGYRYRREVIFSMDEKGRIAYLEWKG